MESIKRHHQGRKFLVLFGLFTVLFSVTIWAKTSRSNRGSKARRTKATKQNIARHEAEKVAPEIAIASHTTLNSQVLVWHKAVKYVNECLRLFITIDPERAKTWLSEVFTIDELVKQAYVSDRFASENEYPTGLRDMYVNKIIDAVIGVAHDFYISKHDVGFRYTNAVTSCGQFAKLSLFLAGWLKDMIIKNEQKKEKLMKIAANLRRSSYFYNKDWGAQEAIVEKAFAEKSLIDFLYYLKNLASPSIYSMIFGE